SHHLAIGEPGSLFYDVGLPTAGRRILASIQELPSPSTFGIVTWPYTISGCESLSVTKSSAVCENGVSPLMPALNGGVRVTAFPPPGQSSAHRRVPARRRRNARSDPAPMMTPATNSSRVVLDPVRGN